LATASAWADFAKVCSKWRPVSWSFP